MQDEINFGGTGNFPATRWSLILAGRSGQADERERALNRGGSSRANGTRRANESRLPTGAFFQLDQTKIQPRRANKRRLPTGAGPVGEQDPPDERERAPNRGASSASRDMA